MSFVKRFLYSLQLSVNVYHYIPYCYLMMKAVNLIEILCKYVILWFLAFYTHLRKFELELNDHVCILKDRNRSLLQTWLHLILFFLIVYYQMDWKKESWYVYIPHISEKLAYLQCVFCFNFLVAFPCLLFSPFVHIQVETQFIVSPFHGIVSFLCWLHFGFIYYKFRKSTTNIIHCEKQHAPYGGKMWTS